MNPKPSTIWAVEKGIYSDYRVIGVFSSKEGAAAVADAINAGKGPYGDEARIVEWELDPRARELLKGYNPFIVYMGRDGTAHSVQECPVEIDNIATSAALLLIDSKWWGTVLHATVWAKDETHAIKIANEHRTRMIALNEWGDEGTTPDS